MTEKFICLDCGSDVEIEVDEDDNYINSGTGMFTDVVDGKPRCGSCGSDNLE